jgi:His-Xaa-Ser system radical SAM maturase HxsB
MYEVFPFRSAKIADRVLVVTPVGDFHFLTDHQFRAFANLTLDPASDLFLDLKAKFFLTDIDPAPVRDILAVRRDTKKAVFRDSVCLHMVVPTIRCNCRCSYCQVGSKADSSPSRRTDMSLATAKRVVDVIHESSSPDVKVEFQGGEPLLNLDVVEFVLKYGAAKSLKTGKRVSHVVCTNLTDVPEKALRLFKRFGVAISTSLDGPKDLHDKQRPRRDGRGSFDAFRANLDRARAVLGSNGVSALATVTADGLGRMREMIDECASLGFRSVFLRPINPFGRAVPSEASRYSPEEFAVRYVEALDYAVRLNLEGRPIVEEFARLLLGRILTPFGDAYVDLQSPAGAGTLCAVYNHDGKVYASDEGRMLGEMGDPTFHLGDVRRHGFNDLFGGGLARRLATETALEDRPACRSCAFLPYCGSDPVRDYVESGKLLDGTAPPSGCRLMKPIFEHLFRVLLANDERTDVFWSWATNRPLREVRP